MLVVVLFDVYTETYAQFLNQGTALVYGIVSTVLIGARAVYGCCVASKRANASSESTTLSAPILMGGADEGTLADPEADAAPAIASRSPPWYLLVIVGLFNGSGNFLMAISQPHTAGLTQTLLNLLGIPLVMALAWLCLRQRPSALAVVAAVAIVAGTASSGARCYIPAPWGIDCSAAPTPAPTPTTNSSSSSAPTLAPIAGGGAVQYFWYSACVYAAAQLMLSGEKVFEETIFARYAGKIDVLTMFCWTIWTQFLLGWALYPAQTLPEFGGLSLSDIPAVIRDGAKCTFAITSQGADRPACSYLNPLLFFVYCAVDMTCYCLGLFVIQRGGANVMVIASAVALPLQQIVLVLPLLGKYGETYTLMDGEF